MQPIDLDTTLEEQDSFGEHRLAAHLHHVGSTRTAFDLKSRNDLARFDAAFGALPIVAANSVRDFICARDDVGKAQHELSGADVPVQAAFGLGREACDRNSNGQQQCELFHTWRLSQQPVSQLSVRFVRLTYGSWLLACSSNSSCA